MQRELAFTVGNDDRVDMSEPTPIGRIEAPLVNPNEPEAQVVSIEVEAYGQVASGDVLLVVETSKATFEVESDLDGYLGSLEVSLNERVTAGQLICEVFDEPVPAESRGVRDDDARSANAPRLTRKAADLADELGVDVGGLPTGRFLTERDVAAFAAASGPVTLDEQLVQQITERSLVVFGAGGLGKSVVDLVRLDKDLDVLCIVDDDPAAPSDLLGVPIAGARNVLVPLRDQGATMATNAVGAIGKIATRVSIFDLLDELGFTLPPLVDSSAYVAASSRLGRGAQIFANAAVCSDVEIGDDVIVNTGAIVSHDCAIGAHAHVAPGATLAGHVEVGERALVGMGVTTAVGISIGADAIVGNGCVITANVPERTIVAAGTTWPKQ